MGKQGSKLEEIPVKQQAEKKKKDADDINYRLKAGAFLGAVTGLSTLAAFSVMLAKAKKEDPKMFDRGVTVAKDLEESGVSLAMRALKWGTIYAVLGCSVISLGIWKLSGANSMEEFRIKMGNILPKIPKNENSQGRTEFSGLNDLMSYLSTDDAKNKDKTKKS